MEAGLMVRIRWAAVAVGILAGMIGLGYLVAAVLYDHVLLRRPA